eukprot:TRINITY_DN16901_c0_g1_i5.p4 TRINITY_DN16901_c0_g1~~TRINITY_DN16901_c0_g1_i5.p4  ORF type:complete len:157 (-),score=1.91 TRINITY_DN16901_c0_g1_i5:295-765(-)
MAKMGACLSEKVRQYFSLQGVVEVCVSDVYSIGCHSQQNTFAVYWYRKCATNSIYFFKFLSVLDCCFGIVYSQNQWNCFCLCLKHENKERCVKLGKRIKKSGFSLIQTQYVLIAFYSAVQQLQQTCLRAHLSASLMFTVPGHTPPGSECLIKRYPS